MEKVKGNLSVLKSRNHTSAKLESKWHKHVAEWREARLPFQLRVTTAKFTNITKCAVMLNNL